MEIIMIDDGDIDQFNGIKQKSVHVVVIAASGFTPAGGLLLSLDLPGNDANKFIATVNERHEVGSLHPKASLTLVPTDVTSKEDAITVLTDVFKLEEEHVKCGDIVFEFRGPPSETVYREALIELATELNKPNLTVRLIR